MVGLWEDSIVSNLSALEIQPDYYHASDFIVYAQLQLAQDAAAAETTKKALETPERGDRPPTVANYTAKAAMPARLALERGDWAAAAALPITTSEYPHADALTRFARALGMARSGRLADARQEIAALERLRTALEKAHEPYWAARTGEQIQAASAWVAFGDGARDSALALMRKAADGENGSIKHVAMENRLYPMRELLGELLLEANQAEAALVEFRKALEATPNRFRGISGAARAAEAAGDRQAATEYYTTLIRLAHKADGQRPEVQQAKAYLASQ
jgi:tetratricopeptide (TPR) repeat protein